MKAGTWREDFGQAVRRWWHGRPTPRGTVSSQPVHFPGEEGRAPTAVRLVSLASLLFAAFGVWAYFAEVTQVSTGQGTVVPQSGSQVIQSMEGGILRELYVRRGDSVDVGQKLAALDPVQTRAEKEEVEARYLGALARKSRLEAEVTGAREIDFPDVLESAPDVTAPERALFDSRREGFERSLRNIETAIDLVEQERSITAELVDAGAASRVELLQQRRSMAELRQQKEELEDDFRVRAREELAETRTEVEALRSALRGHEDALERLVLRSPVQGRVQNLELQTLGGVVSPNGKIMEIVPQDEDLIIEARISPRDIAHVHPGQKAQVEITAYDASRYGKLQGIVTDISPDTFRDEVNPEEIYYRVSLELEDTSLETDAGRSVAVATGMIARVDIETGERTILEYLLKPFNRAGDALSER
ncbi:MULTISPECIES: HlyD family type I secretion periplasmic adaptor subunit [unclassified Thioalkalivibrio]|uniref:HlyD family type I secretion periplasmic adaptor subunit n=1 Tax=unclassified Thioalkalivibrio TaxID=2621013 RepID=UPI001E5F2F27|nr:MULTISPECIES: HlyD family type I secretion periplasmic adaptor subunit [unclassified Thioalkalivibrio]